MPNFDGTGPRGMGRRTGRGRGSCRWDGDTRGAGRPGRTGDRLSDILWLLREAVTIWGAIKALRGIKAGPRLSSRERGMMLGREGKQGPQKAAGPENGPTALETQDPLRLIEYRRPAGR